MTLGNKERYPIFQGCYVHVHSSIHKVKTGPFFLWTLGVDRESNVKHGSFKGKAECNVKMFVECSIVANQRKFLM